MSGANTETPRKPRTAVRPKQSTKRSRPGHTHELISRMLQYESAAALRGIDLASGRFRSLSSSERELHRAELISDYVGLCAGAQDERHNGFDAALAAFCSRICEMQVPSHELIGTFLAAADLMADKTTTSDRDSARGVMNLVLQGCARILAEKSEAVAAVVS